MKFTANAWKWADTVKLQLWTLDTRWHNMLAIYSNVFLVTILLSVKTFPATVLHSYSCIYTHTLQPWNASVLYGWIKFIYVPNFLATQGLCAPLIKTEVAVSKLLKQRPLNDTLGCLVLEEVDQSVLQTCILLWCGLLFGELIQARILFMESLKEPREILMFLMLYLINCTL